MLALAVSLLSGLTVYSQDLHNSANAASIENETNATTGWTGTAGITSVNSTAQNGIYSLRFVVQGSGREARYTFNANPGAIYNISIWARRSATSNNPAFANWLGLSGFSTTVIGSQNWTQYNFTVTATISTPVIRVYAGPIGASSSSDVFIDAVSIFPQVPPDTEAPSTPSGLAVSNLTESSATISWNASTDNVAVVSYTISQNNTSIGTVNGTTVQYQLTNLTPSTLYSYTITASDAANNNSAASAPLEFTTLSPPVDTVPPTVPSNLIATNVGTSSLTLSWAASTDNFGVTNYLIYRDSLSPVSTGNSNNTYLVTGLSSLTSYTFRIAASDEAGNISALSDTLVVSTTDGSQLVPWNSSNANLPTVNWQANDVYSAGRMGIGTAPSANYRLAVNGNIRAKEIIVESGWSDFVFNPGYYLAPLEEVEDFVTLHKHLKDIPTEAQVRAEGIGLAEMNTLLLQKIEEITLYLIQANKRITELEEAVNQGKPVY